MLSNVLRNIPVLVATVVLFAAPVLADGADRKDLQMFNDISKSVNRYTQL